MLLYNYNNETVNLVTNVKTIAYNLRLNYLWVEQSSIIILDDILNERLLDQFHLRCYSSLKSIVMSKMNFILRNICLMIEMYVTIRIRYI